MINIFVKSTNTLAVYHENSQLLTIMFGFYALTPEPQAFRTRVDRWTNAEAGRTLVEYDPIEEEWFACSVLASDCNDSDFLFDCG